jgi:hypothetical protein
MGKDDDQLADVAVSGIRIAATLSCDAPPHVLVVAAGVLPVLMG